MKCAPLGCCGIKAHGTKHIVRTLKSKAFMVNFFSGALKLLRAKSAGRQWEMENPDSSPVVSADCSNPPTWIISSNSSWPPLLYGGKNNQFDFMAP